jgi:hypothetical protein
VAKLPAGSSLQKLEQVRDEVLAPSMAAVRERDAFLRAEAAGRQRRQLDELRVQLGKPARTIQHRAPIVNRRSIRGG